MRTLRQIDTTIPRQKIVPLYFTLNRQIMSNEETGGTIYIWVLAAPHP
jgi:hypothetical protein